ncbi:molecular chaperone [Providencia rettgeri]|uniref:fimbrial biogenesis chaperone n=1 Tax=Providencia rettgeri TaxID=587 RepID=UPI0034E099C2
MIENVRPIKRFIYLFLFAMINSTAEAAVSIDRTRVIVYADDNSSPVNVINHSKKLPYLVQTWLENEKEEKINSPLTALPPLQRVEKDTTVQVRIVPLPEAAKLPQDRESLFYFNLQEIPPKSDKQNAIQFALRLKIKLFYRPTELKALAENVWQEKLELIPSAQGLKLVNPTPFYIVIPVIISDKTSLLAEDESVTLKPKSDELLPNIKPKSQKIQVQYINDYGAYVKLDYTCTVTVCTKDKTK